MFIGDTLFQCLQSTAFCNQYLRVVPSDAGIMSLGRMLIMILLVLHLDFRLKKVKDAQKLKFHYADFSTRATQTGLSRTCHGLCRNQFDMSTFTETSLLGKMLEKVGVIEFGL